MTEKQNVVLDVWHKFDTFFYLLISKPLELLNSSKVQRTADYLYYWWVFELDDWKALEYLE